MFVCISVKAILSYKTRKDIQSYKTLAEVTRNRQTVIVTRVDSRKKINARSLITLLRLKFAL